MSLFLLKAKVGSMAKPVIRNPVAKALRTPKFKPQVIKDKSKYNRKVKHKGKSND